MDHFAFNICHVPRKDLTTADTQSQAPLSSTANDKELKELAELLGVATSHPARVTGNLPPNTTLRPHLFNSHGVLPQCLASQTLTSQSMNNIGQQEENEQ